MVLFYSLGLEEFDIERLLVDSEIEDFIPSDEDVGEPVYMPVLDSPENRTRNTSDSCDNKTESEAEERPVRRGQGRGRCAARGRGAGRGRRGETGQRRGVRRGRGRGQWGGINVTGETTSDGSSVPSNWTIQEFLPQSPVLLEPAYLPINSQGYQKQDYWKQSRNDDLINLIVQKSNQTAVCVPGYNISNVFHQLS